LVCSHKINAPGRESEELFNRSSLIPGINEIWNGEECTGYILPRGPNPNQPVSVLILKGLQQYAVNDTEDGAVCTDAERNRENGEAGETGAFDENSQRIFKIGQHAWLAFAEITTNHRGIHSRPNATIGNH